MEPERRLRIAMVGQKGMPATYGGIERHVEELSARLAHLGHDVTVYCRDSYDSLPMDEYRGVRLRQVRTIASKHLDTIVYAARSTFAALRERPDIVHFHGIGPALFAPLPRLLSRSRVVLTVHGLDNQRDKWGAGARAALGAAYWLSGHVPHRHVAVSRALAAHYRARFGRPAAYIPNGVNPPHHLPGRHLASRFGLKPGRYVLLVGRLVPEKAADLLIRAFRRMNTDLQLAIVGGSAFSDAYVADLHRAAAGDDRIVFTGFVYGDLHAELYANAAVFVQPSRLEGLPLTLLEAAAYGLPILASDIAPHREILGTEHTDRPGGRLFRDGDEDDLRRALTAMLATLPGERAGAAALAERVQAVYTWDGAARDLERLYLDLAGWQTVIPGRAARQRAATTGRIPRQRGGPAGKRDANTGWRDGTAGRSTLPRRRVLSTKARWMVKDVADRVLAVTGVLGLAPVLLAIVLLIKTTPGCRGPAVFRQTRVGRDGRSFTMLKFRTMYAGAETRLSDLRPLNETGGTLFKIRNDPRITPAGRWLRKFSLDELPQLVNVVMGDMSLVGPRPPLPSEVAAYPPAMRRRLAVKPGLTGLWQVSGRSDLSWEESIRLDLQYVENWSFGMDLRILARTVPAVWRGDGAY